MIKYLTDTKTDMEEEDMDENLNNTLGEQAKESQDTAPATETPIYQNPNPIAQAPTAVPPITEAVAAAQPTTEAVAAAPVGDTVAAAQPIADVAKAVQPTADVAKVAQPTTEIPVAAPAMGEVPIVGQAMAETPVAAPSGAQAQTATPTMPGAVPVPPVQPPIQEAASNTNYANNNTMNYQSNYTAPVQAADEGYDTTPMEMKDWVLTILALFIPCCGNIILYCIWAFGKKGNINRRNFCRAALIFLGIRLAIYLFIGIIYGSLFMSLFNTMGRYY